MPELPEVETITRQLNRVTRGKKIIRAEANFRKASNYSLRTFEKKIKGRKIVKVSRMAKAIVFDLEGDLNLMAHLKMTGHMLYMTEYDKEPKYTFNILHLNNHHKIVFGDFRKFGYMKILTNKELNKELQKFGPDPIRSSFTLEMFREILEKRLNGRIKQVLLDQKMISGIGNIYGSEICFAAGVRPMRRIKTLKDKELVRLFKATKKILKKAILVHGTSAANYFDLYGKPGGYVPYLKVYRREGKPCKKCGSVIKKITVGGRGTYYCSKCQEQ